MPLYFPPVNISATGNTSGTLQLVSTGTLVLSGGNGITLSQNGQTIEISGATGGGGGITNIKVSAGTRSELRSDLTFADSNGVSWGLTGGTITATVQTNYLTSQSSQVASASNGSFTFQTLKFSEGGGVTWATAAGGNISATIKTDYQSSNANYLTSQSNQNALAGNGNFNFQTISFSNTNGISFSTTAGSAIVASHNGLTTARASTDAIGLNTAQSNVTWTVNSSGLSLDARGYAGTGTSATNASITLDSKGLAISVAAPGGGAAVNFSAGTTSNNLQTVVFSNSNGVSFGLSGSTITASAAGGGGMTYSYWRNMAAEVIPSTISATVINSTSYIQPMILDVTLSASYIRLLQSFAFNTTTLGTTANTTFTAQMSSTLWVMFYTRGTGASSLSLQSAASASGLVIQDWRLAANANGSQWTLSQSITHPVTGGTSQFTTGVTTTLSNFSLGSLSLTRFTGAQHVDLPFASSMTPGNYWVAFGISSASAGIVAAATNLRMSGSMLNVPQINTTLREMGQVSNSSIGVLLGVGSFSTNAIGTTASLDMSRISSSASHPMFPLQFIRIT